MAIHVLLVDDTPAVRRELTRLLNRQPDIEVVYAAADFGGVLEGPGSRAADVMVVDIHMPMLCSTAAVGRMLHDRPALKLILISFQADPHCVKVHLQAGVSGYVLKDCAYEELVEAVYTVAAGGRYVSPQIEIGIP
jgi:DNA-binding NarL/FixJ family response regulator